MTLREKLSARIAGERQEIQRIRNDATVNERAAAARLAILLQASDVLSAQPQLETLIEKLGEVGIKVGE
jgi:hypothetical protein